MIVNALKSTPPQKSRCSDAGKLSLWVGGGVRLQVLACLPTNLATLQRYGEGGAALVVMATDGYARQWAHT